MPRRIERVQELILQEIAQIINEMISVEGVFITITRVTVTSDLAHARVYFDTHPASENNRVLEILRGKAGEIQHILNKRLNMKFVPRIQFLIDREEEEAARVEETLREIEKGNKK